MTIAVLGAHCSLVVLVLYVCVCICVLYVVCVFHDRHLPPWQPRATTCWRRIDEVHWIMTPKYRYTQDTYYACMCICMYVHVCVCVFWTLRGPMHMYYVSICLCGSPTSSSRGRVFSPYGTNRIEFFDFGSAHFSGRIGKHWRYNILANASERNGCRSESKSEETFFLFIIKIFALRDLFIIYLHLSSAAERVM